ncbi:hypothetical protein Tco_0591496 [Tanacetum coccineum]
MVLGLLVQYGVSKLWIRCIEGLKWIRLLDTAYPFYGYGVSISVVSDLKLEALSMKAPVDTTLLGLYRDRAPLQACAGSVRK